MSGNRPATQIESLVNEIHISNRDKGFWDKDGKYDTNRNKSEMLMLVVSELGEATEALRKDKRANMALFYQELFKVSLLDTEEERKEKFINIFKDNIKDTFEDELADAVIRIFDMCGGLGIDIDSHIKYKLAYNKTRPRLHGKQF